MSVYRFISRIVRLALSPSPFSRRARASRLPIRLAGALILLAPTVAEAQAPTGVKAAVTACTIGFFDADPSNATVAVSWTAPSGVSSPVYLPQLKKSVSGSWINAKADSDSTTTSTSFSDAGTSITIKSNEPDGWRYRVQTLDGGGVSLGTSTEAVVKTRPAVFTFSAVEASATSSSIQIQWTGDPDLSTKYYIYHKKPSDAVFGSAQTVTVAAGMTQTHTISSLEEDTDYEIYLRADGPCAAADGGSNYNRDRRLSTDTITASTIADVTAPGPPTSFTATADGVSRIALAWAKGTGGDPAEYLVYHDTINTKPSSSNTVVGTATGTSISSLLPGTTYYFWLEAKNTAGTSTAVTASATTASPVVPGNFTATAASATKINFSWDAVTDAAWYEIQFKKGSGNYGDNGNLSISTGVHGAGQASHSGLEPGTQYTYQVRTAYDGPVHSDWSTEASATTQSLSANVPGAPTGLSVAAGTSGGTVADADSVAITVSWTAPGSDGGSAITGYKVYGWHSETSSFGGTPDLDESVTGTSYEHKGLKPGNNWWYQVAAVNANGEGTRTDAGSHRLRGGLPSKVTGLSATLNQADRITISWTAPDSGGAAITAYKVYASSGDNDADYSLLATTLGSALSYDHTGAAIGRGTYYKVSAESPAGEGAQSDPSRGFRTGTTETSDKVSAPTGVSGTRSGGNITLTWSAPATGASLVSGYRIQVRQGTGSWSNLNNNTGNANTTYTHQNVSNSAYSYRVAAWDDSNPALLGPYSTVANVAGSGGTGSTDAPSVPRSLTATRDGNEIDLGWTAPSNNGASAITGYRVQVRENNAGSWTTLDTVAVTSYTHANTKSATRYDYRVSAVNVDGEGPFATATVAAVTETENLPSAPRSLDAVRDGTDIDLDWNAPSSSGASAITGYRIQVREDDDAWEDLEADTESTATSYKHEDTDVLVRYRYRVAAINASGTGPWSNVEDVEVEVETPDAPANLTAESVGTDRINLDWDAPHDGGHPITGYRIEVSGDEGGSWSILVRDTRTANTSYSHRNLDPGATRSYRVQALNALGRGPWSNVATAMTDAQPASAPRELTATVSGTSVTLEWLPPSDNGGSRVTGYIVQYRGNHTPWTNATPNTGDVTSYTVTDLAPREPYSFRVAALNSAGTGVWTDPVSATTDALVPGPPTALQATAVGAYQIDLRWRGPLDNGGAPVTGYRIEARENGGDWEDIVPNTGSLLSAYQHRDLSPGAEYAYRVSAINEIGTGPPSGVASARTDAVRPDAPHNLRVEPNGSDQLILTWDAPDYDGGAPVTGYRISGHGDDGEWRTIAHNTRSTATTYIHQNLEPASTWTYRVAAINEAGTGLPSIAATGTTEARVPDPPIDLYAEAASASRIDLRWRAPADNGGSDITGYMIEVSPDGGASWDLLEASTHTTDTEYSHTDLPPGATRHYRVSAINGAGTGNPSRVAYATTEAVPPGRPASLTATGVSSDRIDLRWEPPLSDGGAPIVSYRIDYSTDEGLTWTDLVLNTGTSETGYQHTRLPAATIYTYRVYAINRIGRGPPTNPVSAKTLATAPDPPTNLLAEAVAPDQIDLDWVRPEYDGGADILRYRVEVATDSSDWNWEPLATTPGNQSRYSHEDLQPGMTRHYRVLAVNEAGSSDPSNVASATTDDTAERVARLNDELLPLFAATVTDGLVDAITTRVDVIADRRITEARLGSFQAVDQGGLGALANGASFTRQMGRAGLSAWGQASTTLMNNASNRDLQWTGRVSQYFTGSDIQLRNRLYAGLAGSYASGRYEFEDLSYTREVEGWYHAGMTSLTPYVAWIPTERATAWAFGSYGFGNMHIETEDTEMRTSTTDALTIAGGMVYRMGSSPYGNIRFRAEGWTTRLMLAEAEDIAETAYDLRRVRAAVEWARVNMIGPHTVSLTVSGGLRHDFNTDAANHSGFEVGGGFAYTNPSGQVKLNGNARMLVATDTDYNEWGLGGMIQIDPPVESQGFALQARPTYGQDMSGVDRLWDNGVMALAQEAMTRIPVSVEYRTPGMTPYLRLDAFQRKRLIAGMKLNADLPLALEGASAEGKLGIALRGNWSF